MKIGFLGFTLFLGPLLSVAQGNKTGSSNVIGVCNQSQTGSVGNSTNVQILYCSVTPDEGKKLVQILNKIAQNKLDLSIINKKLDELIELQGKPVQITSAVNGFAISGGNVINPSVTNNYGPPKRSLQASEITKLNSFLGMPKEAGFQGVHCLFSSEESCSYAKDWRDMLTKLHWNTGVIVGKDLLDKEPAGIWIAISPEDRDNPPSDAITFSQSLHEAGFHTDGITINTLKKGAWFLLIGTRPTGSASAQPETNPPGH